MKEKTLHSPEQILAETSLKISAQHLCQSKRTYHLMQICAILQAPTLLRQGT